jgi:hypothetical protein
LRSEVQYKESVQRTIIAGYQGLQHPDRFAPIDVVADLMANGGGLHILYALAGLANCSVERRKLAGGELNLDMASFGKMDHGGMAMMDHGASADVDLKMSEDQVRSMMEKHLQRMAGSDLQVGQVTTIDDDLISTEILGEDGSSHGRMVVNRHSGAMMRAN